MEVSEPFKAQRLLKRVVEIEFYLAGKSSGECP